MPTAPSQMPTLPQLPPLPPTPAQAPVPVPVLPPATTPPPAPTPSDYDDAARRLNLSLFGRKIMPQICTGNYPAVKTMCNDEFDVRMKSKQTALARLDARKRDVINNTSPADEVDSDMVKLSTMVTDAETTLKRIFRERKNVFSNDLARMANDRTFQNLSVRECAFIAARLESLIYDPVAESERVVKNSTQQINAALRV